MMNPISLNSYRALPEHMFAGESPEACSDPKILMLNNELLSEYGIADEWFHSNEALNILSGNSINAKNPPIAMAYAGHQFGNRVPLLGDGRAHMLGQLSTANETPDVQLKGSGRTRFSRGGDGRATLSSVLREYIVSEAMAGLGIPTTRSLAVIGTGDIVYREQPEHGGILVRTARSHIRVGSFQYAASQGDEIVKALADYVIEQYFPEIADEENRYASLLLKVALKQAQLIAQWMLVGFIHGVMNTDNTSIVGETIDFGPCAFMDEFKTDKVFSSIDRNGRYAWSKQPGIGLWNLTRLAETLLPLLSSDSDTAVEIAEAQLAEFMPAFQMSFYGGMENKLALPNTTGSTYKFVDNTLEMLDQHGIDMTIFFDKLTQLAHGESQQALLELFSDEAVAQRWLDDWHELRSDDAEVARNMRHANPAIIARNHRVEEALESAATSGDLEPAIRLTKALQNPFQCSADNADLQTPPLAGERVTATFCGT